MKSLFVVLGLQNCVQKTDMDLRRRAFLVAVAVVVVAAVVVAREACRSTPVTPCRSRISAVCSRKRTIAGEYFATSDGCVADVFDLHIFDLH